MTEEQSAEVKVAPEVIPCIGHVAVVAVVVIIVIVVIVVVVIRLGVLIIKIILG